MTTTDKRIQLLVSELPEVYQAIYGHPECAQEASRNCFDRLKVIDEVYEHLSAKLGRPLRVLDLGCAQGFFCLSLAAKGASVKGIDFQQQNIDLCRALAAENPQLKVSFEVGRIEDVIDALSPGDYDLVTGLSVFHHIVHLHGVDKVKAWLKRLADCSEALILELALRDEPLYWGPSQPEDARELIADCAFYHQLTSFDTHLSSITRPLYVVSNKYIILDDIFALFTEWRDWPYKAAQGAHKGSRRYYFGHDFVCKVFNFDIKGSKLSAMESQRNRDEIASESAFLKQPPAGFPAPEFLGGGISEYDGWLMMERLSGELLLDLLSRRAPLNHETLLNSLLVQLTALEQAGLYHDDVRSWNILVNDNSEARLIDLGSVATEKTDCVWPHDPFLAFFILVNEIFNPPEIKINFSRPFALSPFNLPEPYDNWLYAVWQLPKAQWSFETMLALLQSRVSLPAPTTDNYGFNQWIAAVERGMQMYQIHLHDMELSLAERIDQQDVRVELLAQEMRKGIAECKTALDERIPFVDEILATLHSNGEMSEQKIFDLSQEYAYIQQKLAEKESLNAAQSGKASDSLRDLLTETQNINMRFAEMLTAAGERNDKLSDIIAGEEQQIKQLSAINQDLAHRLEAITQSNSWRFTFPYRYAGNQYHLLRQYGAKQRSKHAIRRILKAAFYRIQQRPVMKSRLRIMLNKIGAYNAALRLYRRIYPEAIEPVIVEQAINNEIVKTQLQSQLIDLKNVPRQVQIIFNKLKNDNKEG
ncbi:methyltransferase domain-containing protein [Sodalis sp. RH22]|uniref:methyltransferase domain-containing protein n=1 Tax=unclassified Sodalis (in: enterobacteria) TaxID=2636512 RepID=UPI0039B6B731